MLSISNDLNQYFQLNVKILNDQEQPLFEMNNSFGTYLELLIKELFYSFHDIYLY